MDGDWRVVVTGLGCVTPLGLNVPATWRATLEGRSGAGYITSFDAEGLATRIACEVKGWDPLKYLDVKAARRTDRVVQFAIGAALQALDDAGLRITVDNEDDVGVLIATSVGGIHTLNDQFEVAATRGVGHVSPFMIPMFISNMTSGQVSIVTGARGPSFTISSGCASSGHAIGEAAEIIRRGDAKVMLAGGAEAAIVPIGLAGFSAERVVSTRNDDPQRACRPFDAARDGFVLGEGSAILVLEEMGYAMRRRAQVYAEIAGYGATADACHVTSPSLDGEARAMRTALRKARIGPEEIAFISAHGTATTSGDLSEAAAIREVFGPRSSRLAVSATKSMHGHLLGAAGALETLLSVLAMRDQVIPPTINCDHPDPKCGLDCVPAEARPAKMEYVLKNAFGFGGQNASLVLKRC